MVSNEEEIKEKEEKVKQIEEQLKHRNEQLAEAIRNLKGKDLDKYSCKCFVCPNIDHIDIKGKELGLSGGTIELARDIAIEYLKKTYHKPKYSSINFLVPAFLYIASFQRDEVRTQKEVAHVCGYSEVTVRKWVKEIKNELDIKVDFH